MQNIDEIIKNSSLILGENTIYLLAISPTFFTETLMVKSTILKIKAASLSVY